MSPNPTFEQINALKIDLSINNFYCYCKLRLPMIYTEDREHLKYLCETLQAFHDNRLLDASGVPARRVILNLPPRHGKSLTAELFLQWAFGKNPKTSAIVVSYNENLSGRFAKAVRDGIAEIKVDETMLVYSDYFPETAIKLGDASAYFWSLEDSHFSFLATSPGATLTGVGGQWLIIDDIIKNAVEANNERILEEHWQWYTDTALSRLESGAKQLVIMTRWSQKDLTGRLLEHEPSKWVHISLPAYDVKHDKMLAPDILDKEEYLDRKGKTDPVIFESNYQQQPYDNIDKLYGEIKTYHEAPAFTRVESYTDTADRGDDFLASAVYGVKDGYAYILDILYTQDGMEKTESQVARMQNENKVATAFIESNNGGEGFARNVSKLLRGMGNTRTNVRTFHQGANKKARILTNANSVTNCILMPEGWRDRWPKFYADVTTAGRMGTWLHDDAYDMLSGIIEKSMTKTLALVM